MGVKEDFLAGFDADYEKALPDGLLRSYYIIECMSVAESCETLLLQQKTDGKKFVAKCYIKNGANYESSGEKLISQIDSNAIPHYGKEFENEKYWCILREYIEGVTLAEYAKMNILTREAITGIAMELVCIMELLHQSEPVIIHRDIKPENIIIREDKSVVLIDFGISRIYKKGGTSDTVFSGTRNFAPPEQYGFMQTDIRSDIYSFGVVLSWLLTGKEKPVQYPETRLERVAAKCCAYIPARRFKNDRALLKALERTTPQYAAHVRKIRKRSIGIVLAAAVLLFFAGLYRQMDSESRAYHFHEPVIEEAVRLSLGKPEGTVTKRELLKVREIYIFTDGAYADMDEYYENQGKWYALDDRIHGKTKSLTDVQYMKNLQILYIGATEIEDLSPLRGLEKLENVSLQDNRIHDISALSDKPVLEEVYLCGNILDNIEPVRTWPAIQWLNLCETGDYDASPLETLKGMKALDVTIGSDVSEYLKGLYVENLRVGWQGQNDLEFIKEVPHVEKLEINESSIRDISAISGREDIVYLNMEGCAVDDLSPLFALPNLLQVKMSTRQREGMEKLADKYGAPSFEIVYTR